MLIDVQFPEIADLLWEIHGRLDAAAQDEYASRVDSASATLHHPSAGSDVSVSLGCNGAPKLAVALGGVVLPLERPKVG